MMDGEDVWKYYHDDLVEKINCYKRSALSFKLGKSWNTYVTELPKYPWTRLCPWNSKDYTEHKAARSNSGCLFYNGPNGLKWKKFSDIGSNVEYHKRANGP